MVHGGGSSCSHCLWLSGLLKHTLLGCQDLKNFALLPQEPGLPRFPGESRSALTTTKKRLKSSNTNGKQERERASYQKAHEILIRLSVKVNHQDWARVPTPPVIDDNAANSALAFFLPLPDQEVFVLIDFQYPDTQKEKERVWCGTNTTEKRD